MRFSSLGLFAYNLICFVQYSSAIPTVISEKNLEARDGDSRTAKYYYGADAASHQAKFDDLTSKQYRISSLSVYGPPSAVRYAAIWTPKTTNSPLFYAIHNANAANYQTWYNQHSAEGYVSTIITATGPRDSAIYAGVMEKISVASWNQLCDLTPSDFTTQNDAARAKRQILKSFREYGTSSDRRICAVWHENTLFDQWSVMAPSTSAAGYQDFFNSETTKPLWRVNYISVSENSGYSAMFTDSSVGDWIARNALTGAQLDAEVQTQASSGKSIIHISGSGSGSSAVYAAIFATSIAPLSRNWVVNGNTPTGFKNNAVASTVSEGLIKNFMKNAGVRQVQLSVAKNGVPLLDKAFTWSETGRKTTQITDAFLLASVSKTFVNAAIQSLFNAGTLSSTTKVYVKLGYSGAVDSRALQITVQHLLDHQAGYNRTKSGDPTYNMRQIALTQSNGARPATMKDVADYMWKQPLDFTPGSGTEYSNYGYLLLASLIEKVTGKDYFTYLNQTIITPLGLPNVKPYLTDPATHASDNVIQQSMYTGLSARQPTSPSYVADIYGGDGQYKDSCLGPTALAANAISLTKIIRSYGKPNIFLL